MHVQSVATQTCIIAYANDNTDNNQPNMAVLIGASTDAFDQSQSKDVDIIKWCRQQNTRTEINKHQSAESVGVYYALSNELKA